MNKNRTGDQSKKLTGRVKEDARTAVGNRILEQAGKIQVARSDIRAAFDDSISEYRRTRHT